MELGQGYEHFETMGRKIIASELASLQYVEGDGVWHIEELGSNKPGEGKKVVRQFVKTIGEGQEVAAAVNEEETIARLGELGILSFVENTGKTVEITAKALLKTLKLARVMEGGGIKVEKITVSPMLGEKEDDADASSANVSLVGRT